MKPPTESRYPRLLQLLKGLFALEALALLVWIALLVATAIAGRERLVTILSMVAHVTVVQSVAFFSDAVRSRQEQQFAIDLPLVWLGIGTAASSVDVFLFVDTLLVLAAGGGQPRWIYIWEAVMSAYFVLADLLILLVIVYVYVDTAHRQQTDLNNYRPLKTVGQLPIVLF